MHQFALFRIARLLVIICRLHVNGYFVKIFYVFPSSGYDEYTFLVHFVLLGEREKNNQINLRCQVCRLHNRNNNSKNIVTGTIHLVVIYIFSKKKKPIIIKRETSNV